MQLTDYEQKAIVKLGQSIHEAKWSNEGLVELIKLCGEYLNVSTVPDYCARTGMSYPGAIKPARGRQVIDLFGARFIIDNE